MEDRLGACVLNAREQEDYAIVIRGAERARPGPGRALSLSPKGSGAWGRLQLEIIEALEGQWS